MERIKSFSEFVNETFLENPADADLLNHDKKLGSATKFGQPDDHALVTCYKDDEEIMTAKKNLQVCI